MADNEPEVMTDEEFAAALEDPEVLWVLWTVREMAYEYKLMREAEANDASR